ncbi:hypothetical protein FO519_009053 [Halicephalobus sp. NKZ332]|nr:hypothetical protein FO519_009053 [Halicephalobus sp. NKZ332]
MLNIFSSCYSASCWPISVFFHRSKNPETLSPSLDEDGEDELFNDGFIKWKPRGSKKRKSFGSIADDTLPRFVPQICVQTGFDEITKNITGDLVVSTQYSLQKKLVILTVIEAKDAEEDTAPLQIRLAFPGDSPSRKHRTKSVPGPQAKFGQTFTFPFEPDELLSGRIRFHLYRCKSSMKRSQFRGECYLRTEEIDKRQGSSPTTHILRFKFYPKIQNGNFAKNECPAEVIPCNLKKDNSDQMLNRQSSVKISNVPVGSANPSRRNSTVDSSGRFCSLPTPNGQPEALISLCYLDQSQKIVVTVEKASNLEIDGEKACDTFLKISAVTQYGEEIAKHRSNTVKATSDPNYECTAVFQISRNELETSSVLIQVFRSSGIMRRRAQIGFVCVGENASSPDAQTHWEQMIQGLGTSVEKWHYLQKPEAGK